MDNLLCDELIQEIIQHLPSSTSTTTTIPLVCKRWLHLYRASKSSISLRITPNNSLIPYLSTFLSLYPCLSSVTIISDTNETLTYTISVNLLVCIASNCSNLRRLRFFAGPVSCSALLSLSSSCKHLSSLTITSSLPSSFCWLSSLSSLKELCFTFIKKDETGDSSVLHSEEDCSMGMSELPLERLCLSGIGSDDRGVGWLWRSCTKLNKLQLKCCEGIGDFGLFTCFKTCLYNLQELELRLCRNIVEGILSELSEHCRSLESLLLYDGGSSESVYRFINRNKSPIQRLDIRLPLDLTNDHLFAVAENFRQLVSLRLESCYLVTGDGLKMINSLEELALVNCDVVDRESGLLTTLGQNLKGLKRLDLSYNEMLIDKELVSMLVSCQSLVDIKLRGCKKLTGFALVWMSKCCKILENVDIMHCTSIGAEDVEVIIVNSSKLRCIYVEESKLTDTGKKFASQKFIEIVT